MIHAAAAKIIATRTSAVTIAIVIISVTRRARPKGRKTKGKDIKIKCQVYGQISVVQTETQHMSLFTELGSRSNSNFV